MAGMGNVSLPVGPYSGLTRISSGNGGVMEFSRFHPESLYSLYCLPAFMVAPEAARAVQKRSLIPGFFTNSGAILGYRTRLTGVAGA
jgi:hypothetical protein